MSAGDLQARTRFEPADVEPRILARWLESGLVHLEAAGSAGENFSIAIPPPNVTGALHMGHALNGTIQDVLIRTNRMRGRRAKWIFGTDHAGIATQRQVEKLLESEGTSRVALGRDAFLERVWQWRERYGGEIIEQCKRLGATPDYEDERFTLDERYVQAVLKVFVELYEQGLIYRDHYMVNWDPGLRSAISDLEVEDREGVVDTLYSIAYPLASGDGELVVATVRPETMLADTAVAVHPDDERYAHLVGQEVVLPLVGRELPVIADEYVEVGLRHRRAEDHAGPRPQRLRDRPPPRPRRDQRHRRGRADDRRRRPLRRPDGRRRRRIASSPTSRSSARSGPARSSSTPSRSASAPASASSRSSRCSGS